MAKRHRWRGFIRPEDLGDHYRPTSMGDRCLDCGMAREYSRCYGTTSTARYYVGGHLVACSRGAWEPFTVPRGCPPCEPPP
jgi:hypothetical protein